MTEFFSWLIVALNEFVYMVDSFKFDLFGYRVSIFGIMVAIIVVGLVVSVFWKGARS